jgi:LPS export ABC transporter protein LptC
MQRFTLLLIPGLIAIVAYIGISSLESFRDQPAIDSGSAALDYNAVSEGINTVLYDTAGSINYTLKAISQIHYNDDSTELEKPIIELYQDGDSRWNIVADSGRISSSQDASDSAAQTIDLSGAVEVFSLDEYGNKMLMTTDYLTVDPQLETLQTDRPVTVVTNSVQQSSIGMFANLKTDEIILHDDIRGRYVRPGN